MNLNQLKKPALEKLAEEKRLNKKHRQLHQQGEYKRKINVLKNKLAAWGIDVTYWRYSQFKIGGILFIIREQDSRYNLVATKKCKRCKATVDSFHINNLLELGRVLADEHGWTYHECPPRGKEVVKMLQPTTEQRVYNLIKELMGLVTNGQKED